MDSLTQLALGAAVGEAVLGKKEGNRAMLWGAIAGTIPDLDILIYPFVNEVQQLAIHRGLSHSILFALVVPIPFGMVLSNVYKRSTHWIKWAKLLFWAFITHTLLDCFTNYGTQIFYPFSTLPVSFDTIFIIDPLYTFPLLIGIIAALRAGRKNGLKRARYNRWGLIVSSLYLFLTMINKIYMTGVFEDALRYNNIAYTRLFSNPSPFNNVMWYAIADDGENLWTGTYSWFDENRNVRFQKVTKNEHLIHPYQEQLPIERLLWFSKGYFTVEQKDNNLYFNDARFSRSDFYLDTDGDYVFTFRLIPNPADSSEFIDFQQGGFEGSPPEGIGGRLVDRILGNQNP